MKRFGLLSVAGLVAFGLLAYPATQLRAAEYVYLQHQSCRLRHGKKRPPRKPPYEAIGSVNVSAGTVTIVPKNGASKQSKILRTTPDTVITINGQLGTLQQLQPGMKVDVGLGADADAAAELTASNPPKS